MSIERVIRCDGPDCECHVQTIHPWPHLPGGFLETREGTETGEPYVRHFCGYDCAMKWFAKFPPSERIEFDPPPQEA